MKIATQSDLKMRVLPIILKYWVLFCLLLVVWAKVAEKVKVTKPKPPTGPPVTIVDDEHRAHFIKQGNYQLRDHMLLQMQGFKL